MLDTDMIGIIKQKGLHKRNI